MPIYICRPKGQDPQTAEGVRLINAKNSAKVRDHLAAAFTIEIAKGTEAVEIAQAGVKLEQAQNGGAAE